MRIYAIHNYYKQLGGEDRVFEREARLLEKYGHEVFRFSLSNSDLESGSAFYAAGELLWNRAAYRHVRSELRAVRPDVVHVHNFFPRVSASVFYAAKHEGVPTVWTSHNYRPFCLNGVLFRDGSPCEDCVGRFPFKGIAHRCYRGSAAQSLGVAAMRFMHHDLLQTLSHHIDAIIVSSQFAASKAVEMGLHSPKLHIKPNPVEDHGVEKEAGGRPRGGALFIGRLDERKGIRTLLRAFEGVELPLTIIGDGELAPFVQKWIDDHPLSKVNHAGWLSQEEVVRLLRRSAVLVHPAEFYESFGNVIVEAFSCSVPVITTRLGAQQELVKEGETGFLFDAGSAEQLNQIVTRLVSSTQIEQLAANARREYEQRFSEDANVTALEEIYGSVVGKA